MPTQEEIAQDIKVKLLAQWLPEKNGGLHGLVELAAQAASEVAAESVQADHTGCHQEYLNLKEEYDQLSERMEILKGERPSFVPVYPVPADDPDDFSANWTMYACGLCEKDHRTNSSIGKEHYGAYLEAERVKQAEVNVEMVLESEGIGQ